MDGERDCVAAWIPLGCASKLEDGAATLVFQSGAGASIISLWAIQMMGHAATIGDMTPRLSS